MRKLTTALSTLFLLCSVAWALDVPDKPSSYVNDYAGLLSPGARASLETRLASFDKETSNQLVVAVFPGLEGASLEDFSIRLAEKWRPGTEKRDNGVILLVFRDDRELRIEVGYGLEGALPDALAKRIIENEIVPRFKQGDFDGGVTAGVEAIVKAARGEYSAVDPDERMQEYGPWVFSILVFYLVLPVVCYLLLTVLMSVFFGFWGFVGSLFLIVFLAAIRKFLLGSKALTYSGRGTRSGGWYSGGGGFSGGGGSFGGGGASGRW